MDCNVLNRQPEHLELPRKQQQYFVPLTVQDRAGGWPLLSPKSPTNAPAFEESRTTLSEILASPSTDCSSDPQDGPHIVAANDGYEAPAWQHSRGGRRQRRPPLEQPASLAEFPAGAYENPAGFQKRPVPLGTVIVRTDHTAAARQTAWNAFLSGDKPEQVQHPAVTHTASRTSGRSDVHISSGAQPSLLRQTSRPGVTGYGDHLDYSSFTRAPMGQPSGSWQVQDGQYPAHQREAFSHMSGSWQRPHSHQPFPRQSNANHGQPANHSKPYPSLYDGHHIQGRPAPTVQHAAEFPEEAGWEAEPYFMRMRTMKNRPMNWQAACGGGFFSPLGSGIGAAAEPGELIPQAGSSDLYQEHSTPTIPHGANGTYEQQLHTPPARSLSQQCQQSRPTSARSWHHSEGPTPGTSPRIAALHGSGGGPHSSGQASFEHIKYKHTSAALQAVTKRLAESGLDDAGPPSYSTAKVRPAHQPRTSVCSTFNDLGPEQEAEERGGEVDGLQKAQQWVASLPGFGTSSAASVAPHQEVASCTRPRSGSRPPPVPRYADVSLDMAQRRQQVEASMLFSAGSSSRVSMPSQPSKPAPAQNKPAVEKASSQLTAAKSGAPAKPPPPPPLPPKALLGAAKGASAKLPVPPLPPPPTGCPPLAGPQGRSVPGIGPGEPLGAAAHLKRALAAKEADERSTRSPAAKTQPAGQAAQGGGFFGAADFARSLASGIASLRRPSVVASKATESDPAQPPPPVPMPAGKPSEGVVGDRDALLAAIRGGKFQLRRTPQPGAAPQPGGSAVAPVAGGPAGAGMSAILQRAQSMRASMYPESAGEGSDSDWEG